MEETQVGKYVWFGTVLRFLQDADEHYQLDSGFIASGNIGGAVARLSAAAG
jgi:hypothetical protein